MNTRFPIENGEGSSSVHSGFVNHRPQHEGSGFMRLYVGAEREPDEPDHSTQPQSRPTPRPAVRSQATRCRERVGRKPKLTKEIAGKLVRLLKAGHVISVACSAAGIGERTFHRWMEQGWRDAEGAYWQFRQQVLRARAQCEAALLNTVHKHAAKDWRAAAWLLERLFPARYSLRVANALCEAAREPEDRRARSSSICPRFSKRLASLDCQRVKTTTPSVHPHEPRRPLF